MDQPVANRQTAWRSRADLGIVGHDDERTAVVVDPIEEIEDLFTRLRIEITRRLVGQQQ